MSWTKVLDQQMNRLTYVLSVMKSSMDRAVYGILNVYKYFIFS